MKILSTCSLFFLLLTIAGPPLAANSTYAADRLHGADAVSVVDTATNQVFATVKVGTSPWAIAITPDGKYAYVINKAASSVSIINTETHTDGHKIPLPF